MKTNSINPWLRFGAAMMLAGTAVAAMADDSSVIRLALRNTGVDTDAVGSVLSVLKSKSSVVSVNASKLTPGQSYTVTVGETPEATLVADKKGRLVATFSTKPKKNKPVLDFDPRGQLVAIRDGATSVLEATVSGPSEPAGIVVDERAKLSRLSGSGEASARYQALRDGRRFFTVKVERVEPGELSVYVNGIFRGAIQVSGRQTTVIYDSNPATASRRLLDFDPRGQVVDIALGANLVFTGKLEAKANNVNVATPSIGLAYIPSTGVDANGTARAKTRVDKDARRKFSVEVEDVPTGAYQLYADDVLQGTINVVTSTSGTEGEIEFSSREDNGDELPLTFDPSAATFTIQSGGVIYFQGKLAGNIGGSSSSGDNNSGGTSTPPNGGDFAPESFAGLTLNLDDSPGGDLMRFTTATSGVDLGIDPDPFTYVLTKLNASQVQVNLADGDKLDVYVFTFASATAGSWARDEYRDGTHKDHDTGPFKIVEGSPTGNGGGTTTPPGGGTVTTPTSYRESLASTRLDSDASGHAKFEVDVRGRRKFNVEIEDVAAGSYELWVAGVRRGTIRASLKVTQIEGEIEFEDDDSNSHLPLDFDPRGQLIEVKTAAGVFFSHLFGFGSTSVVGSGSGGSNTTIVMPSRIEVPLFNLAVSSGASAKAKFKRDDRGRRNFEVEIEDAPVGSYALLVAGVSVATINVVNTPNGTHGEIEFEDDDDNTHLPLTFDPLGQEISLTRDGEVRFQRVFPTAN